MTDFFKLEHTDSKSNARAGMLTTDHGTIRTPVFMPVGTQGTVKALEHRAIKETGAKIILGNTYHLFLRPGNEVISHFGGLHKFINWNRALLTDSGGYQVFSLQDIRKIDNNGVNFKSHIDGSSHLFTPENVVETQRIFGSDIMMVLDECVPYPSTKKYAEDSLHLSLDWARRSKKAFDNSSSIYGHRQFLFGIGQGGMFTDLRQKYIQGMLKIEFDGYAIGGLSVGEEADLMYDMVEVSTNILPNEKPRYLMGVGTPENILESIERGIDMFDCVLPSRNARNGQLFTSKGKINIRNSKYRLSDDVIDNEVESYASNEFSLGYLRHLFIANEILGLSLATLHNIAFFQWLMRTAREKILSDEYRLWKINFLEEYNSTNN